MHAIELSPGLQQDEAKQKEQRRHDKLEELALFITYPVGCPLCHKRLEVHPKHPPAGTPANPPARTPLGV